MKIPGLKIAIYWAQIMCPDDTPGRKSNQIVSYPCHSEDEQLLSFEPMITISKFRIEHGEA